MKAKEAPEKIYLEREYPNNGVLPNGLNYISKPTDIEYTRTDVFIKKACDWLFDQAHNYTDVDIDYKGAVYSKTHTDKMIEDFRKAMDL